MSEKVFGVIDGYDEQIMMSKGAWAFRCSNPSPVDLAPVKTYVKAMSQIGWDKLQVKSECLTRYMHSVLQQHMGSTLSGLLLKYLRSVVLCWFFVYMVLMMWGRSKLY